MTTTDPLTQRVLPSNSSSVKFSRPWVLNPNGTCDIVHWDGPASITLTFHGTQAGAFGVMNPNPNNMPLWLLIASGSVAPSGYTPPALRDRTPSQLYITDTLPCDDYELTLFVNHTQLIRIDHFDFAPCPTSGNESLPTTASSPAASSAGIPNTSTSPLSASASSSKPLSAGLIVGLVISSVLLFLMLCGVALLLFMRRRRQRSSAGPGSWSHLPGRGVPQSPSQALLSVGGGIDGVKDRPRTRFGLYMFKFKPAPGTPMRDPSPPPATEEKSTTPGPVPAPPQGLFDPRVEKPPQYPDGDWTADPGSSGLVLRGYLPDSKEWIAPELEGGEQGDSSEWGTVPTDHAVESVPRGKPSGSFLWT